MANLTPAAIVQTLAEISKEIEAKAVEIEDIDTEFTQYKLNYRKAFLVAFMQSTETSDTKRRYDAEIKSFDELQDMERTEQVLRAAKESMRVLRDRLEIGRSLSAVMRMEWNNNA
jgi:hypothetical protein